MVIKKMPRHKGKTTEENKALPIMHQILKRHQFISVDQLSYQLFKN